MSHICIGGGGVPRYTLVAQFGATAPTQVSALVCAPRAPVSIGVIHLYILVNKKTIGPLYPGILVKGKTIVQQ